MSLFLFFMGVVFGAIAMLLTLSVADLITYLRRPKPYTSDGVWHARVRYWQKVRK
jgi:hypothetical protein